MDKKDLKKKILNILKIGIIVIAAAIAALYGYLLITR